MKRRTKDARWAVLFFWLLGLEVLVIAKLYPFPNFWLAIATPVLWGIALLIAAWDVKLFEGELYNVKLLWSERGRLWRAYWHFRKYHRFYHNPEHKQLEKLFGKKPHRPISQAVHYVLENIPSFDYSYFPDMEKSFKERENGKK